MTVACARRSHRAGGAFDLVIAVAVLAVAGSLPTASAMSGAHQRTGPRGAARPVPGALPAVTAPAADAVIESAQRTTI